MKNPNIKHIYIIKNENGDEINRIIANESFVKKYYDHWEFLESFASHDIEIEWRNSELNRTDSFMLLTDYPYKEALTEYRQRLRDYTDSPDFPFERPDLDEIIEEFKQSANTA